MSGKREKPYNFSRHTPYKRRRPVDDDYHQTKPSSSATVVITGLSPESSVLDLKSRFEIYGSISRTRMDSGGIAYITFRSKDSAESAIAASLDPSFGITLNSNTVQVNWASDPLPQWREGVKTCSSKLLKPELPLSRHGRGNKLGSPAVNNTQDVNKQIHSVKSRLTFPSATREIVAYDDDIL